LLPSPLREGWGEGQRILLIRPDHVGDLLLAAPTARLLAKSLPGARIDWLVGPWTAEVIRRSGSTGDILTCEFPGFTRQPKRSIIEPYQVLWHAAARLRPRRYDAALILRPDHWWGALLAALAGIPRRFGFDVDECRPLLTDLLAAPAGHTLIASQDLGRLAAKRLGTARPVTSRSLAPYLAPAFAVADDERARARDLLHEGCDGNGPTIAIHPGTGAPIKNWPPARWAAVASRLQSEVQARIVLTGGPPERELTDDIAGRLPRPALVLAGQTTLGELAAVFEQAALVLGGDSGPLHIAAAVNTPTLRLYGPTSTAIFGPWGDRNRQRALVAGLPCQPCGELVAPPCGATRDPVCLQTITVNQVVTTALEMLCLPDPSSISDQPVPAPTGAEL
jgi:heptosyltransferase-2/heptosyltransferase-3